MAEGLRRLRAAGMRRAILGFDPNNAPARALYTSLGFRPAAYFAVARKAL
jgi:ribosomal protein S18 acetylase RimI-like enzyme